jgi:hypothetical protein
MGPPPRTPLVLGLRTPARDDRRRGRDAVARSSVLPSILGFPNREKRKRGRVAFSNVGHARAVLEGYRLDSTQDLEREIGERFEVNRDAETLDFARRSSATWEEHVRLASARWQRQSRAWTLVAAALAAAALYPVSLLSMVCAAGSVLAVARLFPGAITMLMQIETVGTNTAQSRQDFFLLREIEKLRARIENVEPDRRSTF